VPREKYQHLDAARVQVCQATLYEFIEIREGAVGDNRFHTTRHRGGEKICDLDIWPAGVDVGHDDGVPGGHHGAAETAVTGCALPNRRDDLDVFDERSREARRRRVKVVSPAGRASRVT